jgi:voltage-gated potassium channel
VAGKRRLPSRASLPWRKIRASVRDTFLLLRQFAWPLLFFILAMVGGGLLYYRLAQLAGQPVGSRMEAIYIVLGLTFLEAPNSFPDAWYLQAFHFVMPLVGIGILAQGLADFARLFFNRHDRGKEWEMAVAATFKDHVVLIGLGHLGFRVARELYQLGRDVVVIELNPQADLTAITQQMGIAVIHDDGKRSEALAAAGVAKADAIVCCTQNDNLNLQVAFKARKINPNIRVVARIFDDEFAETIEEQFGFEAMSATDMAAPKFAAAATGLDITRPIAVEGQSFSLVKLDVQPNSLLNGRSVAEIEQVYGVSVVLVRHEGASEFHPAGDRKLAGQDVLAVLAGPAEIARLIEDND